MKKIIALYFTVFLASISFGQEGTERELSDEIKSKLLYCEVSDYRSSNQYQTSNGMTKSGPSSRKLSIKVKEGENGSFMTLTGNAEFLKNIIKGDEEALVEFEKAIDARSKVKRYNILEMVFKIGSLPLAAVAFIKFRNDKTYNKNLEPGQVEKNSKIKYIAAGAAIGALGTFYYFYYKTEKMMSNYRDGILKAVEIYNANIIKNSER